MSSLKIITISPTVGFLLGLLLSLTITIICIWKGWYPDKHK
jgi:hypothetical protein